MADKYNFTVDQGATYSFEATYTDVNGAAIDLTGYSAKMQVRKTTADSNVVLELTDADGITISAAEGKLLVIIPGGETEDWNRKYVYDLWIYQSDISIPLCEGTITVDPSVTRNG